ncbi:hypothetical protein, partial [Bacteroides xylanisolvens]|uniref:hypothetical protein n=1 Tax=Bacteroides xylanisolvens TaxID=371601 RepID=UPI001C024BBA
MTKYKESKTNTNVEIIRWESYMITYICVIEQLIKSNHTISRHDNFIGCFSADKIKMSARK